MDISTHSLSSAHMNTDISLEGECCALCELEFHGRDVEPVIVKPYNCKHLYDMDCITPQFNRSTLQERKCIICLKIGVPLQVLSGKADPDNPFIRHELLEAVYQRDIKKLAVRLTINPELAWRYYHDPESAKDNTLLFTAALNGYVEVAELLLDNGAKVDDGMKTVGSTPLHAAATCVKESSQMFKMVERLLCWGADIEAKNTSGYTPLDIATIRGSDKMVRLLLKNGALP